MRCDGVMAFKTFLSCHVADAQFVLVRMSLDISSESSGALYRCLLASALLQLD